MLPRIKDVFEQLIEPHPAVGGDKRRASVRILAAFMLGLAFLSLLSGIVFPVLLGEVLFEPWLAAALYLAAYFLSRTARPIVSEFTVVIGLTGVMIAVLINYGIIASTIIWFLVPIVLGVILLPMWGAIIFTLINIGLPFGIALSSTELEPGDTFSLLFAFTFTSVIALATKYARQRDLERLEQQAEALARSRGRYKQLFEDVPVGLFETTVDGQILQANPAMLDILGYPDLEALRSVSVYDLYVDPSDRDRWRARLSEEGSLRDYELQFIRSDGQRIWARENVRIVPHQNGEGHHYRGSIEDVTEQRRLREQLAEQHQQLQMIIAAMPNVLLVVDEQNRLTALYLPPNFPPLLKQDWATTMEKLVKVLPEELAEETQSSIETVRKTGVGHSFERAVRLENAQEPHYLRVKLSLVNETGDILIVVDDVTEIKQAEASARAYAAELELRNEELDAFSHTVAHDLRRPLTHIVGYADLLKQFGREELSNEMLDFVTSIEDAAYNMSEMIQGLLMLAKLRHTETVSQEVNMSAIIDAAIKRVKPDIEERGVQLKAVNPIPNAVGYGPWLEEAFVNLLSNAIKYIGKENEDPRISISAMSQGDCVRYEVADNGLGISREDQANLFEMLTRFHQDQASGTGLGLSIVQRIVTKLGGELGVNSEPGQGSTFWFTLPKDEQAAEASP